MEHNTIERVEEFDKQIEKSLARDVVMTLARGSLVLQNGDYLTEDELDADRELMRNYKFRHLKSQP